MIAATIPEIAAGNTTRNVDCNRWAPSPYEASRSAIGTARNASSATEAMIGIVRIPTPIPAAASVNALSAPLNTRVTNSGLMVAMAK